MVLYRFIAQQPLAVPIDPSIRQPFPIYPDADLPRLRIRTLYPDRLHQMQNGGTRISIEFVASVNDLIEATRLGLEAADDVLASLSMSAGIPFAGCLPVEITVTKPHRFITYLIAQPLLWDTAVTPADLRFLHKASPH